MTTFKNWLRFHVRSWKAARDFKRFNHPCKILFVAGLPKSGTEWVNAMLQGIPGYHRAMYKDPKGVLENHSLSTEVLQSIPENGFYVLKTHVEANPESLSALRAHDLKAVIMWRDLRDQAVSRYYHILNDPTHRDHETYNTVDMSEGMSLSVDVVLDVFLKWVEGWDRAIQENSDKCLVVTFENLRDDPVDMLRKILQFYEINLSDEEICEIATNSNQATRAGANLKDRLEKGSTFRSGKSGDWRGHFSQRDVDKFKEVAGEHLIKFGYEKDLNWEL